MPDSPKVEIGLKEVYDLLVEVRNDVIELKASVTDVKGDVADHEGRLRSLERLVWGAAGIGTVGGALVSQVITLVVGK